MDQVSILALAAALGAGAHSLDAGHWLPIVLAGQARRWSPGRTAAVAAIAGLTHAVSTVTIGFAAAWAGQETLGALAGRLEAATGALVLCVGLVWTIGALRRRPWTCGVDDRDESGCRCHGGRVRQDRGGPLFGVLVGARPCLESLPLFFVLGAGGVRLLAGPAAAWALVTLGTYTCMTWIAARGLNLVRWRGLRQYGELAGGCAVTLMGALIITLG